jgi:two-component system, OmpR family, phosphate regulon response regulator PhoB
VVQASIGVWFLQFVFNNICRFGSFMTRISSNFQQISIAKKCVLVVEDETAIRDSVSQFLIGEGYDVMTASNGREAIDIIGQMITDREADKVSIDLIILDVMLPGINGLDLCQFIRKQGSIVPILMLSARGSEADRVAGLEIGADDYLVKPFGLSELRARCRALFRRSGAIETDLEETIEHGNIILYPQQYRVLINDKEINLSRKEFALLILFMQNPRRVFSRDLLIERVWGADFMGDTKTVDVHIRWLRSKIEDDPSRPQYLMTVRGFGYRFG